MGGGSAQKHAGSASYVLHTSIAVIKDALSSSAFIQQLLTKAERSTVRWEESVVQRCEEEVQRRVRAQYAQEDGDNGDMVPA